MRRRQEPPPPCSICNMRLVRLASGLLFCQICDPNVREAISG